MTARLQQTPAQTVGPYFAYGLVPAQYGYAMTSLASPEMADETTPGTRIRIEGLVLDGAGTPIDDALIELWQADSEGRYGAAPGANRRFSGLGRCGTGTRADRMFWFDTVKPGPVNGGAPHANVVVQMRGMLLHAFTRLYFEDEAQANAGDPVLALVPAERRGTLIARLSGPGVYRFDIRMQGDDETVFFDL